MKTETKCRHRQMISYQKELSALWYETWKKKKIDKNTHRFCHTGTNWEWITSCFTMFDSGCQNAYTYSMNRSGCSDARNLWNEPKRSSETVGEKCFKVNHIKKKKKKKKRIQTRNVQKVVSGIRLINWVCIKLPFGKCQHYCARWLYPKHWCTDRYLHR